jgi:hypothetical protein
MEGVLLDCGESTVSPKLPDEEKGEKKKDGRGCETIILSGQVDGGLVELEGLRSGVVLGHRSAGWMMGKQRGSGGPNACELLWEKIFRTRTVVAVNEVDELADETEVEEENKFLSDLLRYASDVNTTAIVRDDFQLWYVLNVSDIGQLNPTSSTPPDIFVTTPKFSPTFSPSPSPSSPSPSHAGRLSPTPSPNHLKLEEHKSLKGRWRSANRSQKYLTLKAPKSPVRAEIAAALPPEPLSQRGSDEGPEVRFLSVSQPKTFTFNRSKTVMEGTKKLHTTSAATVSSNPSLSTPTSAIISTNMNIPTFTNTPTILGASSSSFSSSSSKSKSKPSKREKGERGERERSERGESFESEKCGHCEKCEKGEKCEKIDRPSKKELEEEKIIKKEKRAKRDADVSSNATLHLLSQGLPLNSSSQYQKQITKLQHEVVMLVDEVEALRATVAEQRHLLEVKQKQIELLCESKKFSTDPTDFITSSPPFGAMHTTANSASISIPTPTPVTPSPTTSSSTPTTSIMSPAGRRSIRSSGSLIKGEKKGRIRPTR